MNITDLLSKVIGWTVIRRTQGRNTSLEGVKEAPRERVVTVENGT